MTNFTIINTNARSLCPKMNSLIDCVRETDARLAIVTETWLKDGPDMEEEVQDLSAGAGLGMIARNRRTRAVNGNTYGGVAVLWREGLLGLREYKRSNPEGFEVLTATGVLKGHSRKVGVIACYIPPNYTKARADDALEFIADTVVELKRKFKDPYLIIGGDFNQWPIADGLLDFPDLTEADAGPTRNNRSIDRLFTNMGRSVTESGTLAPLETDDGQARSDHRVVFCKIQLARKESFVWQTYTYRHYCEEAVKQFKEWIVLHDWQKCTMLKARTRKRRRTRTPSPEHSTGSFLPRQPGKKVPTCRG